ncbi:uncharacterized protein YndB with AHSA1/START domain [Crenobacter luteus]|uniref:Activator of Hsp90 ATPase homologue 1/2-like C-terminal domain-containing protein n=1 Tax=Crenobacter luteus TaxID=1452487 RepID=A0A163D7M2_9NEIS|nr:SRPBCC family protein [Crenobacter luteus]KZE34061.1 hypothetical protein AVW16_07070 [Crenobacter luteus]TCP09133.1 uncharacterized protein YndB with AHSA1/START domain [Crenobacter luteus]
MNDDAFVYVCYIDTTPEKLHATLTDPEETRLFWGHHRNVSDWAVGSPWRHEDYKHADKVDLVGTVLENAPPRRLVLSWAAPADADRPERHSRVAFDIEPYYDLVRLTVTHDRLGADEAMRHGIVHGWPLVLSSLKTLLETGHAFAITARRWEHPAE